MSKWLSVLSLAVTLALVQGGLAPTDAWSIPQGACCYPDASCADPLDSADCESQGGVYQGDGTSCAGVECAAQPQGACCYPDASCADDQYQAQCEADGGTYMDDGTACFEVECDTEVKDETGGREGPSQFALFQNHPNPFNQTTKIEFTLAKSGFVNLIIYDLLGREVRTLASEHLNSGYKSVFWDGKNDSGEDIASGIYLYRMDVGDFTEAKKLLLLK